MNRYFLIFSFLGALLFYVFGQTLLLLVLPNTFAQTFKLVQYGFLQFFSLAFLALIISSRDKRRGRGRFRIPHFRID